MKPTRITEPCSWNLCPERSTDALLDVTLIFDGRYYSKRRVPLCQTHLEAFRVSGRIVLWPEVLLAVEPR